MTESVATFSHCFAGEQLRRLVLTCQHPAGPPPRSS